MKTYPLAKMKTYQLANRAAYHLAKNFHFPLPVLDNLLTGLQCH